MSFSRDFNWCVNCETEQWKVSGQGVYMSILKITKQNHSRIYIIHKKSKTKEINTDIYVQKENRLTRKSKRNYNN